MAGINERWEAQQRSRWMRPDAARYLRPDVERYYTPAAWQAMTPAQRAQLSGATIERKHVADERSIADLQRERSWLARQKLELLELYDLHLRLRLKALNPSQGADHYLYQPRIPKHNEGGGRWTREGGDGSSSFHEGERLRENEFRIRLASSQKFPESWYKQKAPGSWAEPKTFEDHFRQVRRVGARDPIDYVRKSQQFRVRALQNPATLVRVDERGILRIYDPIQKLIGVYNAGDKTITYFPTRGPNNWNNNVHKYGADPTKMTKEERERMFRGSRSLLRYLRIRGGQE